MPEIEGWEKTRKAPDVWKVQSWLVCDLDSQVAHKSEPSYEAGEIASKRNKKVEEKAYR